MLNFDRRSRWTVNGLIGVAILIAAYILISSLFVGARSAITQPTASNVAQLILVAFVLWFGCWIATKVRR